MLQKLPLKELFKKPQKQQKICLEIASKITSVDKSKSKEKKDQTNELEEIYIPSEKRQQIINDLRLFWAPYKNGIPKNCKFAR